MLAGVRHVPTCPRAAPDNSAGPRIPVTIHLTDYGRLSIDSDYYRRFDIDIDPIHQYLPRSSDGILPITEKAAEAEGDCIRNKPGHGSGDVVSPLVVELARRFQELSLNSVTERHR